MGRISEIGKRVRIALRRVFTGQIPIKRPSFRQFAKAISLLGTVFISFVAGAATLHFELRPADFLRHAFAGYEAWQERGGAPNKFADTKGTPLGVTVDEPNKTFDGFTLHTTTEGTFARLVDMRGNEVHRWSLPFREVWPKPEHIRDPLPDSDLHWFRGHLFPNGDLLVIYQADSDTPHGYGLAKLDKDSKVLWKYAGNAHHDVDVGEDGKIYVLTHEIVKESPARLPNITAPYLADYLVVLSSDGQPLQKIPLVEAFRDSPYALMLAAVFNQAVREPTAARFPSKDSSAKSAVMPTGVPIPVPKDKPPTALRISKNAKQRENGDVLHANSVKVLNPKLASKFPQFKPGQVLVSLRGIDAIAVVDLASGSVVWAVTSIWTGQHDAEFVDNGRILIYDNQGSGRGARVIEFDPVRLSFPWSLGEGDLGIFIADSRGAKQRLPNGNTLIVDPEAGRIIEVTRNKELVWQYGSPPDNAGALAAGAHSLITGASRHRAESLTFLKGIRVRP